MCSHKSLVQFTRTFVVFAFLLLFNPAASAYGSYGYHHGYGHHGYGYGSSVHVGVGHYSHDNTLAYVILGIFGLYVLHEIFDNDDGYDRQPATRPTETIPPYRPAPKPKHYPVAQRHSSSISDYQFNPDAGWNALNNGDYHTAMTVFAIQSQQDLTSGLPKIGFALAAASSGELDRGVWTMHKAMKMDPYALNAVKLHPHMTDLIEELNNEYQSKAEKDYQPDQYHFMIAILSYLQNDIKTAEQYISKTENNQSTQNLAQVIRSKS